jgi:phospholipase/lecithinase/hemolysin
MGMSSGDKSLRRQFDALYVFGDSLSDYGSRAAQAQHDVFAPDASPPWSGVTFSNGQSNWQTRLSRTLGLHPGRLSDQADLPADPYYLYANELVSPPDLATKTQRGTSYAMGGATTGSTTLYQFTDPTAASQLQLENLGVASQINNALGQQRVRLESDNLAVIWAGGNDLLLAFAAEQPLDTSLNQLIDQLRNDLETVLRFGDARQAVLTAVSPIRGEVNGVPYQAPFLSGLILAGSAPTAPEWLQEWVNQIDAGVIDEFRLNVQAMVADVQKAFPYANVIDFNPEYQAQYDAFGAKLGDFASYGIDNTLGYAQSPSDQAGQPTNRYLYLDDLHPTSSGHHMLGNAIELTLHSVRDRTAAATLTNTINSNATVVKGSLENDLIIGKGRDQVLRGLRGNDVLIGRGSQDLLLGGRGDDLLEGRGGDERLRGGSGADFFRFTRADTEPGEIDRILDFNPQQGDRLGINAVLGMTKSLSGQGWTYIAADSFSSKAGELRFVDGFLQGDLDGDGRADLQVRLDGITTFNPDWIS